MLHGAARTAGTGVGDDPVPRVQWHRPLAAWKALPGSSASAVAAIGADGVPVRTRSVRSTAVVRAAAQARRHLVLSAGLLTLLIKRRMHPLKRRTPTTIAELLAPHHTIRGAHVGCHPRNCTPCDAACSCW